jgi:hypothetical protein
VAPVVTWAEHGIIYYNIYISMDWFKGHFAGKPPYLTAKSMVSCRFSLKLIH